METNSYESVYFFAGDVVKLNNVSCEGYTIDDCTLLPSRSGDPVSEDLNIYTDNDDPVRTHVPRYAKGGRAYITFRPVSEHSHDDAGNAGNTDESPTQHVPYVNVGQSEGGKGSEPHQVSTTVTSSETLTVVGISDESSEDSVSVTFSPDDPHSSSISKDTTTGAFTLDVLIIDASDDPSLDDYTGFYVDLDAYPNKCTHISSPFLSRVWDTYEAVVDDISKIEGVCVADNRVSTPLADLINRQITELASREPVDWHPGSNDCVRDLVHPSMYCYVEGESPLSTAGERVRECINAYNEAVLDGNEISDSPLQTINGPLTGLDRWGRLFEKSKFQWLPSIFHVSEIGKVAIRGYINNLDRSKYEGLYASLARLFEAFLPMFEGVYDYISGIHPLPFDEDEMLRSNYSSRVKSFRCPLYGKDLSVITKIVDYELRTKDDKVDGVFHVEGMSTDHILMTGIYVVDRDDDFLGGNLIFRRTFFDFEGSEIFQGIAQIRPWKAERIVEEGIRPLGTLPTPKGRMIVFPNSHIHKLSLMTRALSDAAPDTPRASVSSRRVVVFWLVDPSKDILTTQEVPRQQSTMSYETACQHRLELMEERRKRKGKLNGERKISLCEH